MCLVRNSGGGLLLRSAHPSSAPDREMWTQVWTITSCWQVEPFILGGGPPFFPHLIPLGLASSRMGDKSTSMQ